MNNPNDFSPEANQTRVDDYKRKDAEKFLKGMCFNCVMAGVVNELAKMPPAISNDEADIAWRALCKIGLRATKIMFEEAKNADFINW